METDINQQILAEIRSLRRLTKRVSIGILLLLALFVIATIATVPTKRDPYTLASRAMRAGDYLRALQLMQKMVAEHPENYYPHEQLGMIYLESGDVARSEKEYSRAYALNPSENIGKALAAVRKRQSEHTASPTATP